MLNGLPLLNPFPDLLILSSFAPFLLRAVLGIIAINSGLLKTKQEKDRWIGTLTTARIPNPTLSVAVLGGLEILSGIMLVLGFYTQVAGLVYALIAFSCVYAEYKNSALVKRDIVFYILAVSIALSLVVTGAGAFSLDLPL